MTAAGTHKCGSIEVVCGCMSSGKSEALIHRIRRAQIAKRGTIVFKPAHDTRTDGTVNSRSGSSEDAITVRLAADVLRHVRAEHAVVGLDEAHFFDAAIVGVAMVLVEMGKRVIIAGLDTDFRGEPFGYMPQLLAIADDVTKLKAVCMQCGEPAVRSKALFVPKTEDLTSPEFIGGDEKYEARCRDCHRVG